MMTVLILLLDKSLAFWPTILTVALMLQCCFCLVQSVAVVCKMECVVWLNILRYRAKVITDSLQEVAYENLIGAKMNDLDLCLEVI